MQYMSNQPFKLLRRASIQKQKINKRLDQYSNDFTELRALAAYQEESVRVGIQKNKHLNDNFRKLEEEDQRRKDQLLEKIQNKIRSSTQNRQKALEGIQKDAKTKNERVNKIYQRHIDDDLSKEKAEEEQACRARNERVKEIEEKQQRKMGFRRKGSYDQALQKIRKRDRSIEEFALSTYDKLDESFKRNSKKINPEMDEARLEKLKKYFKVLREEKMLLGLRTNRCMQHHCSSLEAGEKMAEFKRDKWEALSKTIEKMNQTQSLRAKGNKEYLDEEERNISQRCEHRLNHSIGQSKPGDPAKTSSFMITSKTWRSEGKNKREYMKTIQQTKDQEIIDKHISATFRNKGEARIHNKFLDLNRRASFNAKEFL